MTKLIARSYSEVPTTILKTKQRWSRHDVDALLAAYQCDESLMSIARRLQRSEEGVEHKLRALGLKRLRAFTVAPWSIGEVRQLSDAIREGKSYHAIAEMLGRTTQSVRTKQVEKMLGRTAPGVRTKHEPRTMACERVHWTKSEQAQLLKRRREGATFAEIQAEMPNRSYQALRKKYDKSSHLDAESSRFARALTWSSIEENLLLNLRERLGLDFRLIARLLGTQRSYNSVSTKFYSLRRLRADPGDLGQQKRRLLDAQIP
jgi:transposase